jgi:hypothetical protein
VVHDCAALALFPHIHPMDYQSAIAMALSELDAGSV